MPGRRFCPLDAVTTNDPFIRVRDILAEHVGYSSGITIDQLARRAGFVNPVIVDGMVVDGTIDRRGCEELLQTRLPDFPFPICSGARGYFVPSTAEEINHYANSLRSRIRCIAIRLRTVRRSAEKAGWTREGKRFVSAPVQLSFLA